MALWELLRHLKGFGVNLRIDGDLAVGLGDDYPGDDASVFPQVEDAFEGQERLAVNPQDDLRAVLAVIAKTVADHLGLTLAYFLGRAQLETMGLGTRSLGVRVYPVTKHIRHSVKAKPYAGAAYERNQCRMQILRRVLLGFAAFLRARHAV